MELTGLERFSLNEQQKILAAYQVAKKQHEGQIRKSGEPYFVHPVAVAQILIDCGEDVDTVIAGLLHDTLEDTNMTFNELVMLFGISVARIVDGVTKLPKVKELNKQELELGTIRKFMIHYLKDIRVIKVKFADRLHNMRTLEFMSPKKQFLKAEETLEVYAPLAFKIGAYRIKEELEDLSLKYLEPQDYATAFSERELMIQTKREMLNEMMRKIHQDLFHQNILCTPKIKIKNVYGIYKFLKQNSQLVNMDDLLSIKLILESIRDCYPTLGVVNQRFRSKNCIQDFISNPKPNGYQSLHAPVFAPDGSQVHIRIRTEEMDKIATYGITSSMYQNNPFYKEQLFSFIESIDEEYLNNQDFWRKAKQELFGDNVYVYTSKGEIRVLPKGATVVDFAYLIHTGLGNSMVSAIVNNELVLPSYVLQNSDQVEIISNSNTMGHGLDWLNYANTTVAKREIRKLNRAV